MIQAAGGVVLRTNRSGDADELEVLVVHRPDRGDWSLPKGKRRRREAALDCALREVREETGLHCDANLELPTVRYTDRRGRRRLVRYWTMHPVAGEFTPNDEVDQICWVSVRSVGHLLTYEREIVLVEGLQLAVSVA